jgi:hypothetical protein
MATIDFATYTEAVSAATDPDDWFATLDERLVAIGDETCITRVLGIHPDGAYLWIQLAYEKDDRERNVVLRVNGRTTTSDVLVALRSNPPGDALLEIIRVPHRS